MEVSSNTLFHYTKEIGSLKSILAKGFYMSYCMEESGAFPMISFCDLRLSQAKYYLDNYGKFSIGMSQEWGVRNGLNPVVYLEEKSYLSKSYNEAGKFLFELHEDSEIDIKEHLQPILEALLNIDRFRKPRVGMLNGNPNYKFYDEREWRYIPNMSITDFKPQLNELEYPKYKKKNKKPHLKKHPIKFKASDIRYLIVATEDDLVDIVDYLQTLDNLGSPKEIQVLTTRIITANQINEDV